MSFSDVLSIAFATITIGALLRFGFLWADSIVADVRYLADLIVSHCKKKP